MKDWRTRLRKGSWLLLPLALASLGCLAVGRLPPPPRDVAFQPAADPAASQEEYRLVAPEALQGLRAPYGGNSCANPGTPAPGGPSR